MPLFRTVTLGCKVNQYETEYLRQGLLRAGFREAAHGEAADLCIVNTCTVTGESDYKSRKIIRALARDNPRCRIVVMGCYATRAPEELASLPQVVQVVFDKRQLPQLVRQLSRAEAPRGISSFGRLHRAYVKIQDGCNGECSYCIVPKVRPVLASRTMDDVLEEVRRLIDHGHREIVLTGIHLGHYGADLPDDGGEPTNLTALLRRLTEAEGEFRIRLSSLEAAEVTPALLELMARFPDRICPHLHLPLQSGSNAVLTRMKRRLNAEAFLAHCDEIRRVLTAPALTTDVIVGFPGETEADFEASCRVVREAAFSKVHVFRYSPRDGTLAAGMPDQIPPTVKQHRAEVLAAIGRDSRGAYCASLVGQELQVVAESLNEDHPRTVSGTADRYVAVRFPGGRELMDRIVRVSAMAALGDGLLGICADSA